jgi:hypothetical protein
LGNAILIIPIDSATSLIESLSFSFEISIISFKKLVKVFLPGAKLNFHNPDDNVFKASPNVFKLFAVSFNDLDSSLDILLTPNNPFPPIAEISSSDNFSDLDDFDVVFLESGCLLDKLSNLPLICQAFILYV